MDQSSIFIALILRHLLTFGAGAIGIEAASQGKWVESGIAFLGGVIGIGWSWLQKRRQAKDIVVAERMTPPPTKVRPL